MGQNMWVARSSSGPVNTT